MSATPLLRVETALTALRRGMPVCLKDGDACFQFSPVEYVNDAAITMHTHIALTSERAAMCGTPALADASSLSAAQLKALAGEIGCEAELSTAKAALKPASLTISSAALHAGLTLLKWAALLPSAVIHVVDAIAADSIVVTPEDVTQYCAGFLETLHRVTTAPVKLFAAGDATLQLYRSGPQEHVAIIIGDIATMKAPLLRIHSSCFTGDLLGSLRCDCGEQLHAAMQMMRAQGGGVILYLMQEGRGIGLANKLRAYVLQQQGLDTVEANHALGYGDDERMFGLAGKILQDMGICTVRLVTNNPRKIAGLEEFGVTVQERVPLIITPHEHTEHYLQTKFTKLGHLE